jgi:hypothetical protein
MDSRGHPVAQGIIHKAVSADSGLALEVRRDDEEFKMTSTLRRSSMAMVSGGVISKGQFYHPETLSKSRFNGLAHM